MNRKRLDELIVSRGLAETRSKAQALIMAGEVIVDGRVAAKPGVMVYEDVEISLEEKLRYVSRGGLKLEHALNAFGVEVRDFICLDVGASTGGFTDCLLQSGASKVYALDVGYGQLDYRLRQDKRVICMEKINAHYPFDLPEKVDLGVVDVSFISLTSVIPNMLPHLKPSGRIIALLKPQFEAGREEVGKGGVIKDPAVHARTIGRFIIWMNENSLRLLNMAASPILGAQGNREFLIFMGRF